MEYRSPFFQREPNWLRPVAFIVSIVIVAFFAIIMPTVLDSIQTVIRLP